jgi:hypothetical protein
MAKTMKYMDKTNKIHHKILHRNLKSLQVSSAESFSVASVV